MVLSCIICRVVLSSPRLHKTRQHDVLSSWRDENTTTWQTEAPTMLCTRQHDSKTYNLACWRPPNAVFTCKICQFGFTSLQCVNTKTKQNIFLFVWSCFIDVVFSPRQKRRQNSATIHLTLLMFIIKTIGKTNVGSIFLLIFIYLFIYFLLLVILFCTLIHFRLNKFRHTIYCKSRILSLGMPGYVI